MNITNFLKVVEFNTAFGHPYCKEKYLDIFDKEPDVVKLRLNLIEEEIGELDEAIKNDDIIEIIDALSDILYVAYGLGSVFGIDLDETFRGLYKSNFFKNNYEELSKYQVIKNTNYNMVYNEFYLKTGSSDKPRQLSDWKTYLHKNPIYTINTLNESLKYLRSTILHGEFDGVERATCEIIYFTYALGVQLGIDLDYSFDLVHRSNMSKICDSEQNAVDTVKWYIENESRYDSPAYRHSKFGYVVYNKSTGKILKNINYQKVDLSVMCK